MKYSSNRISYFSIKIKQLFSPIPDNLKNVSPRLKLCAFEIHVISKYIKLRINYYNIKPRIHFNAISDRRTDTNHNVIKLIKEKDESKNSIIEISNECRQNLVKKNTHIYTHTYTREELTNPTIEYFCRKTFE